MMRVKNMMIVSFGGSVGFIPPLPKVKKFLFRYKIGKKTDSGFSMSKNLKFRLEKFGKKIGVFFSLCQWITKKCSDNIHYVNFWEIEEEKYWFKNLLNFFSKFKHLLRFEFKIKVIC